MTTQIEKGAAPGVVGRICDRCHHAVVQNDTSSICNGCIAELDKADREADE